MGITRILIVDDERRARLFLREVLKPFGLCDEAEDGETAVEMFREALVSGNPYKLVFMDIMMPVMDGQQALENIRAIEHSHGHDLHGGGVKVVMITALNDSENVIKAYHEGGASAYLPKPVTVNNLLDLLADLKVID